jgi:hypothetical protein
MMNGVIALEHLELNLHHPQLQVMRGNPHSSAPGLLRFARGDDSHFAQSAFVSSALSPFLPQGVTERNSRVRPNVNRGITKSAKPFPTTPRSRAPGLTVCAFADKKQR